MRHPLRRKYLGPRLLPLYALALFWLWLAEPTSASLAAGGLVAALGAALRAWGAGHLVKTDRLVVAGPYAFMRHPLYAGTLLAVIGLGAAAGRSSLLLVVAAFVPFFALYYLPYKDRIEGARLERRYGDAYAAWRRAVPAILPRLSPWRPGGAADPRARLERGALPRQRRGRGAARDRDRVAARRDPRRRRVSRHALGALTRESLPARTLFTIKRGGWLRPDVLVADTGAGPVVVKDWAPRSRPVRALLAGVALRREARAHRSLEGLACVPRLLGRLDARALVLEYRPGTRVSGRRPWIFDARFADALARCVARVHARGVVHLDLAHRSNLGADPGGRPVLFDLGAAFCPRPGSVLGRGLLRGLALADDRALRKWRRRLAPPPR